MGSIPVIIGKIDREILTGERLFAELDFTDHLDDFQVRMWKYFDIIDSIDVKVGMSQGFEDGLTVYIDVIVSFVDLVLNEKILIALSEFGRIVYLRPVLVSLLEPVLGMGHHGDQ
jgi:hypothetical protein